MFYFCFATKNPLLKSIIIGQLYREVKGRIAHIICGIRNDGILVFFESEWLRLNIPIIFRSFWLMRCGIHIYIYLASSDFSAWTDVESLNTLFKIVLVRGCETLTSLLGMASVFSWICAKVKWFSSNLKNSLRNLNPLLYLRILLQIYLFSQTFMQIPHEGSTHIGPLAATLFIIFSFQYGLSTLKPASRLVRLMRILVLIITCFLHFTYTSVDTVLMSLATRQSIILYIDLSSQAVLKISYNTVPIWILFATQERSQLADF